MLDARSVLRGSNRRLSTANLGQLKLVASDASSGTSLSSEFGKTVAIDGETVVAGAYGDDSYTGSAHVFRTTDGGATYDEMAKLTASDGAAGDWFGSSVAIAGGTVVVGAYAFNSNRGKVYVFLTTNGGATYDQVAELTASDAAAGDYFGVSVAIDGDTVVVGTAKNCVYIFRTTDGWTTHTEIKLTAADAAHGDGFGDSVAITGGTVVVGAPYGEAAYVFNTTDGGATYDQVAKLTAADGWVGEQFGGSAAIDGDTVVIGAAYDYGDVTVGENAGAAYVFRTSDGWDTHTEIKLTASDGEAEDYFGYSVAMSGDTVVVGAMRHDDPKWNSGSAFVFNTTDGGATYEQVAKLTDPDAGTHDSLGYSVAIAGAVVVVGSDNNAAYVFSPTVATPTAALGSDSATRAGGTFLALLATVLAL